VSYACVRLSTYWCDDSNPYVVSPRRSDTRAPSHWCGEALYHGCQLKQHDQAKP